MSGECKFMQVRTNRVSLCVELGRNVPRLLHESREARSLQGYSFRNVGEEIRANVLRLVIVNIYSVMPE